MLAKGTCTAAGTVTAQAAVLHNVDILYEIIAHCASLQGYRDPHLGRQHFVSLARVSKLFYHPVVEFLWANLPSLHPSLLLLPEYERSYRAHSGGPTEWVFEGPLSEVSPNTWTRFRGYAALVRSLGLLSLHPSRRIPAPSAQIWMHLARLSSGAPLLPSLQMLHLEEFSERCEDLRLLVSTTLSELYLYCSFNTRPGSEYVFSSALQDILTNTPSLTYLQLIDFDSCLLTMVAPELLYRLKELKVGVRRSMDRGQVPQSGFPDVQSLRIMSTLPKLERLTVDLNFSLAPAFHGFCSLTSLKVTDFNHNAAYFLTMCSSPHLRELHLDFWVCESWTGLRTICSAVAHRAPELRSLTLSFEGLQESEWSPEHTLDTFSSLFALRHLSEVQIRANEGTFEFTNSILAAFAEVWPALVRLDICCHPLPIDADDPDLILDFPALAAPPLEPEPEFQSVTLCALAAFAQHSSGLRTLRLPYLYLAAPGEDSHPARYPEHSLRELLICRCDIADGAHVTDLARAVENMFPHIDVGESLKESLCYQTPPSSSTARWRDILLAVEERRKELSVA